MNNKKPTLIKGNIFQDDRGVLRYANDFNFKDVKRFYQIDLPKKGIIRAFHGHFKEAKHVFVISGTLVIYTVKLTDKINPSKNVKPKKIILDSKDPKIFTIPAGYANGIMSIEKDTRVIFFSNKKLSESLKDDYRFPTDYWGKEIWKT